MLSNKIYVFSDYTHAGSLLFTSHLSGILKTKFGQPIIKFGGLKQILWNSYSNSSVIRFKNLEPSYKMVKLVL